MLTSVVSVFLEALVSSSGTVVVKENLKVVVESVSMTGFHVEVFGGSEVPFSKVSPNVVVIEPDELEEVITEVSSVVVPII